LNISKARNINSMLSTFRWHLKMLQHAPHLITNKMGGEGKEHKE